MILKRLMNRFKVIKANNPNLYEYGTLSVLYSNDIKPLCNVLELPADEFGRKISRDAVKPGSKTTGKGRISAGVYPIIPAYMGEHGRERGWQSCTTDGQSVINIVERTNAAFASYAKNSRIPDVRTAGTFRFSDGTTLPVADIMTKDYMMQQILFATPAYGGLMSVKASTITDAYPEDGSKPSVEKRIYVPYEVLKSILENPTRQGKKRMLVKVKVDPTFEIGRRYIAEINEDSEVQIITCLSPDEFSESLYTARKQDSPDFVLRGGQLISKGDRSAICIHRGNSPSWSDGCLLPGVFTNAIGEKVILERPPVNDVTWTPFIDPSPEMKNLHQEIVDRFRTEINMMIVLDPGYSLERLGNIVEALGAKDYSRWDHDVRHSADALEMNFAEYPEDVAPTYDYGV